MKNQLISVLYVWPIKVLIENQCPASPKLCQPSTGMTVTRATPISLSSSFSKVKGISWRSHEAAGASPTLLSWSPWYIILVSKNSSFFFPLCCDHIYRPTSHLQYSQIFRSIFLMNRNLLLTCVNFTFQNCTFKMLRGRCSEREGQRLDAVATTCRTVFPGLSCVLCAYKEEHLKFQCTWSRNCFAAIQKNQKNLEGWNAEHILAPVGSLEEQNLMDMLKKPCACSNSLWVLPASLMLAGLAWAFRQALQVL